MYSFKDDYSEGAHPRILDALLESNKVQAEGYGQDKYTRKAIELLKRKIKHSDVHIHLLSSGTQINLTVISAFLRPHEAAIAADCGHILTHETGAVEATGHKIISVKTSDGKLSTCDIKSVLDTHTDIHMVKPRLVYISNSTEIGTIYTKSQLIELSGFCKENGLILYMDGARLGSALCTKGCSLELCDIAELVDAFYIGGTKNGALIGEVLVICHGFLNKDFRYHIKQKGGLLAKGRLLGIQFLELFRDNLYFDLARHANVMADILRDGIIKAGFTFFANSPSNQVFPVLPNDLIEKLKKKYSFHIWSKVDNHVSAIRLVTSWATPESAVTAFIKDLILLYPSNGPL